jgi:two-component system, NarL family, response regulator NreC
MPIRIVLADDHVIVRQGLRYILEGEGFQVVGEASNGQEVIRLAEKLKPDVAVLDVGMPLLNAIDATKEIVKVSPRTKIILLTMHSENHFVMNALRAGARGYLLKERAAEDLVQAVTEVTRGGPYLSPSISRTVVQAYLTGSAEVNPDPLSVRERQVLQLVAEGKTSKDVATILGISVKTAESHRNHIMDKLNIHDVAGLVRYAIRNGLIELEVNMREREREQLARQDVYERELEILAKKRKQG